MERMENETYEDYCVRRKEKKKEIKEKLTPKYVWYSKYNSFYGNRSESTPHRNQGTYRKPVE